MNITQVKETCLYVRDLESIKEFYEQVVELPLISYLPDKHLFLRAGRSVLLFFNPDDSAKKISPPSHFGGGKQHVAFEVPAADYELTRNLLEARGVPIIDEVTWKSGERSFYFEDPAGNILEIVPDNGIWD